MNIFPRQEVKPRPLDTQHPNFHLDLEVADQVIVRIDNNIGILSQAIEHLQL